MKAIGNRRNAAARRAFAAAGAAALFGADTAFANPVPDGIGLQASNSTVMSSIHEFHDHLLLPIITAISVLILVLLLVVVARFNARANPTARRFSHNTLIEVIWTTIPIMILLVIALPSFELLFRESILPDGKQTVVEADGAKTSFSIANTFPPRRRIAAARHVDVFVEEGGARKKLVYGADYSLSGLGSDTVTATLKAAPPAGAEVIVQGGRTRTQDKSILLAPSLTIKAKGYQWQWSYAYPEFGVDEFFARLTPREATKPELYLLETDNHVVVPVGETVRLITQAADVIHSWALPAFGVKIDAVPGRNNEAWFRADREGMYYGQCSELCGVDHAFMPIAVEVRSRAGFEAWVDEQRKLSGLQPMFSKLAAAQANAPQHVAAAETAPATTH